MTGRERLLRTIKGEQTDRIAISPFLYYNAIYEMFGYEPDVSRGYYDFFYPTDFDAIGKYVEYCDYFGFDVMHLLGTPWNVYDLSQSADNWEAVLVETGDNDVRRREITINTPGGQLRQTENVKRSSKYLVVSAIDEYMIKTAEDFEILRKYCPPADMLDCSSVIHSREATGDKGLACPIVHGAFNTLSSYRKLDDVFMDPLIDEGFYREMIEFFADRIAVQSRLMVEAGADAVEIGGNMAGSNVGAVYFGKYIQQYEQHIINAIHDAGAYVIYHNCGDAAKVMHLYNDMNIDVLGYLTPPPFGDVDLAEALRVLKPTMALRGNIDQVEFLMKATPSQVEQRVREVVEKAGRRGRFILSTTDFFFDETPYDNIRAFVDAGIRYGTGS